MKIYDLVKDLLEKYPEMRNSDKKLIWAVYFKKQLVQLPENPSIKGMSRILYMNFLQGPSFESITRARRKVQELNPELWSSMPVRNKRRVKEQTKGTFIFREEA